MIGAGNEHLTVTEIFISAHRLSRGDDATAPQRYAEIAKAIDSAVATEKDPGVVLAGVAFWLMATLKIAPSYENFGMPS